MGETAAWMVGDGVQQEATVQNHSTCRPVAQQNRDLHLLHLGRVHTPSVLLLHHVAGELQSSASSPDATLPHASGDIHPPL
jgi:hypothetical protein